MNHTEAVSLAGRIDRRGPGAWWARRKLLRAGDRGSTMAIDTVWGLWLADPGEVLWDVLSRWRCPSSGADRELSLVALGRGSTSEPAFQAALAEAAARIGHPIAATARARILAAADDQGLVDATCAQALEDSDGDLLAFCMEHGLLPSRPADRAAFFLLTGQHDQYRATDPDGSLLAVAYDAAPEHVRGRIQRAAVDAGHVALVRVLTSAGPTGRLNRMTRDDVRYLVRKLADGQEWDELWRVAQQVSLLDAVDAARRIRTSSGDAWKPVDDAGRALFERLAGADVDELKAASRALDEPEIVSLRPGVGVHLAGALSADGRYLAVAVHPGREALWYEGSIRVFELPSGRFVRRYDGLDIDYLDGAGSIALFYDGDALLVARGWGRLPGHGGGVIERYVGGKVKRLYKDRNDGGLVALHLGGFVSVELKADDPCLRFFTLNRNGVRRNRAQLRAARRLADHACGMPTGVWGLPTGPLVLGGRECLMVLDAQPGRPAQLLAHGQVDGPISGVCAPDPDHLITTGPDGVHRWRLAQGRLTLDAGPKHLGDENSGYQIGEPTMLDRLGEVAIRTGKLGRELWFLDPVSLSENRDRKFAHSSGGRIYANRVLSSLGGAYYAVATGYAVHVVIGEHSSAVVALADRPLGDMTPADLVALGAELRTDLPGLPTRPFLELLQTCLEHRFGADVALGTGASVAGEHDIALGGEGR